jgi:hypothetical protein
LYGTVRRVLAPRGVEIRARVEHQRDWYDLALAVDGREGRLAWDWVVGTRGVDLVPAIERWREQGFEALVWDNAKAHKAKVVRLIGMPLVHQPSYSPELNPAERIGEAIRAATEGKVYGTVWHKMAAVERFLEELRAHPERIRSLTGWEWIASERYCMPHKHGFPDPARCERKDQDRQRAPPSYRVRLIAIRITARIGWSMASTGSEPMDPRLR